MDENPIESSEVEPTRRGRRRRRRKGDRPSRMYLLPHILTTGNLFFGFYAIVHAFTGAPDKAALGIILAAVFDTMDGPAILELKLDGGERRYVALLGLEQASARIAVGEREFELASALLERRWSGRSFLLWRNFESLPALAPGMQGSAVRWLQARLSELGYLREGDASSEYDALTIAAIRRFQSAHALETTGGLQCGFTLRRVRVLLPSTVGGSTLGAGLPATGAAIL